MTVNFRKRHGTPTTTGGVMFKKRISGAPTRGPNFSIGRKSNKLHRALARCRSISKDAMRAFLHQEMLVDLIHPHPHFVGKLYNDARNMPYGTDSKCSNFLARGHMFTTRLNKLGHFKSEQRNSQKWLTGNTLIRDYYRRLQILDHVRERDNS